MLSHKAGIVMALRPRKINADYISRAGTHGVDDICSGETVDVVAFVFCPGGMIFGEKDMQQV